MNVKRGATDIQYVLIPLSENLTNNIIKLVSGQTGVENPCDPE